MNPSVDQPAVTTPENPVSQTRPFNLWPVLTGLVAFPLLQYGPAAQSSNPALALGSAAAAYLLCVYLYRGVAEVAFSGRIRLLALAGLIAVVVAVLVTPSPQLRIGLAHTAMIPLAALLVGWYARTNRSQLRWYLIGTATVVVFGLIMYAPVWAMFMNMFRTISQENAEALKQTMTGFGYHTEAAETYADQFQQLGNTVARLIPAMSLMSLVTQFSVGFLWFLIRKGPTDSTVDRMPPFTRWKVPFALTPVIIVAASGRLLGNDMIVLAADNVLLALSIYYCVGGLALLEYGLRRFKIRLAVRILFYVVLTLMGLLGYVLTVLLGFVDSFADWRKISRPSIELEKN